MHELTEQQKLYGLIRDRYTEIEQIAEQQVHLLTGNQLDGAADRLQELINRRQACMDDIDAGLKKFPQEGMDAAHRKEIEEIIGRILQYDEKSQQSLQSNLGEAGHKLIHVQDMKKAHRAYGGQDQPTDAWFIDRKR